MKTNQKTPKHVAGRLTIMRTCGGDGDDKIRIIVLTEISARLVVATMSPADFALCLTGRGEMPAQLRLFSKESNLPDYCDHCPSCSVEYESRITALTEELAQVHRQQAELRVKIADKEEPTR